MKKTENDNTIWYFVDNMNDHEFIILKIGSEFTLLQSWINLWSLESWLGDGVQFPNFDPRFNKMNANGPEKMKAFQAKMGQGQFFTLEKFWKIFEESYADYLRAMASFKDNYDMVKNYILIGSSNMYVL